jgi:hypothetical protein
MTPQNWQEADVNTRRPDCDELAAREDRKSQALVLGAGSLRSGDSSSHLPAKSANHPDERLSLFWRVFGGTILSIAALIGITLYNSQASSITELRSEVSRLNEARAETVKKEEFNTRTQNLWDRMQQLQEMRVTVTSLKEQVSSLGEKANEVKAVQDKLTQLEQRLKIAEDDHKALAKAEITISALEQKAAARDAQLKTVEDERKDLNKQLQDLRERLAKVEGATETKPMPKMPGKD